MSSPINPRSKLQIFISWSGAQAKMVATALRVWIAKVLDQKVTPFVSSEDIEKGDRGLNKIASELESSNYGIIVVTPSNKDSSWINFEAGALGKSVSNARVAPLLVGLSDVDLTGPLKQFQNTEATDKDAVFDLVKSINRALGDDALNELTIQLMFDAQWGELERVILDAYGQAEVPQQPRRSESDLLDEVLTTVRSLQRDMSRMQLTMRTERVRSGNPSQQIAHLILDRLDPSRLSITDNEDEIVVSLPDDAPVMKSTLLESIRRKAINYGQKVTIQRPNGSRLTFNSDGSTERTGPEDPEV